MLLETIEKEEKRIETWKILLSLYLIFFSFFVALCASSEVDPERQKKVVESLKQTFSETEVKIKPDNRDNIFKEKELISQKLLFDELKGIIALVKLEDDIHLQREEEKIIVSVPETQIFEDKSYLIARNQEFLTKISELVKRRSKTNQEANILITISANDSDNNSHKTAIRRLGELSRFMTSNGVPENIISISLDSKTNNRNIEFIAAN